METKSQGLIGEVGKRGNPGGKEGRGTSKNDPGLDNRSGRSSDFLLVDIAQPRFPFLISRHKSKSFH